jgi:hypothetical protein
VKRAPAVSKRRLRHAGVVIPDGVVNLDAEVNTAVGVSGVIQRCRADILRDCKRQALREDNGIPSLVVSQVGREDL